jgi:AmpE protein
MKFLVVLVCLLINHYWREQRKFSGEAWFPGFQRWLSAWFKQFPAAANHYEIIFPMALLLLPATLLTFVLWVSDGVMLGFITLALHILVLLFAFDRLNVVQLSRQYLTHWQNGDYEGAWSQLKQQAPERFEGSFAEYSGLHQKFYDFLIASYFERLFVVIFWYLLLGPAGVLLYTLGRIYCAHEACSRSSNWQEEGGAGALIMRLVFILEWLPARVLALTFSLAGDFVGAFNRLQETFLTHTPAVEMVKACAVDASGSSSMRMPVQLHGIAGTTASESIESYPEWAVRRIEELLSLMLRSQVIWISAMALLTVYGIGN